MKIHRYVFLLLPFVVTALFLSVNQPPRAQLNLTRGFRVSSLLPQEYDQSRVSVREFLAHRTGLYFLMSVGPPRGKRLLLHTDYGGKSLKLLTFPSALIGAFSVDDLGNVFGSERNRMWVYDSQGNQTHLIPTQTTFRAFTIADGSPIGFSLEGQVQRVGSVSRDLQNIFALGEVDTDYTIAALPNHRIVIMNGAERKIHVSDLQLKTVSPFVLQAPEIEEALANYLPEDLDLNSDTHGRAVITYSLSTTSSGEMFVGVTGHSVDRGAVVLRVDTSGRVLESLRCQLPAYGELMQTGNPTGRMSPHKIGATDDYLFVVDARGYVASYRR